MKNLDKQTLLIQNKLVLLILFTGIGIPVLTIFFDAVLFVFGIVTPLKYAIFIFIASWSIAILLCLYIIKKELSHIKKGK